MGNAKYVTPAVRAERELGIDDRWSPDAARAPVGFHIVLRLVDDRVIAQTVAQRRTLVRVVYEQGNDRGLVAFRAADTHLHIIVVGSRFEAGMLARYTAMSLCAFRRTRTLIPDGPDQLFRSTRSL